MFAPLLAAPVPVHCDILRQRRTAGWQRFEWHTVPLGDDSVCGAGGCPGTRPRSSAWPGADPRRFLGQGSSRPRTPAADRGIDKQSGAVDSRQMGVDEDSSASATSASSSPSSAAAALKFPIDGPCHRPSMRNTLAGLAMPPGVAAAGQAGEGGITAGAPSGTSLGASHKGRRPARVRRGTARVGRATQGLVAIAGKSAAARRMGCGQCGRSTGGTGGGTASVPGVKAAP